MKRLKFFFAVIISLTLFNITNAQDNQPYGFNSAYVEKTTETNTAGIIIKTSEKIFINDGGNLVRREVEQEQSIPMMNQTITSISISITNKDSIITWDPATNTGTIMENPVDDALQNMDEEQAQQFGQGVADAMNTEITEVGTGEVAGVMCIVNEAKTNMMGMNIVTTTWTYLNFLMKSKSEGMVTSNEEVTLFIEDADNDPGLFVPPANVTFSVISSPFGN
jgi:hypothetical protein